MLTLTLALADDPSASVAWNRGTGRVQVEPPEGWHVAPDAPSSFRLTADTSHVSVSIDTMGDPSAIRFPVGEGPFLVELGFAICEDGGSTCRPVRFQGSTVPQVERGSLVLDLVVAAASGASSSGAVKVYDFQAVWCPPATSWPPRSSRRPNTRP